MDATTEAAVAESAASPAAEAVNKEATVDAATAEEPPSGETEEAAAAEEAAPVETATETARETAVEAETAPEAAPVAEAIPAPAPLAAPEISEHLQKRLDTYFARLRQDFPDGRITRLNTAHKKLAERGAELRRLIGYEGRLDEFFALGGFTYQRGVSGRPALPAEQTASVEERLRAQFSGDVPTLLAVQQADHRLYLDLRAAARRVGCTVGEYLDQFRAG